MKKYILALFVFAFVLLTFSTKSVSADDSGCNFGTTYSTTTGAPCDTSQGTIGNSAEGSATSDGTPLSAVVTVVSQSTTNGATISVPITVTGFANKVGGIDFSLQYDNTLLTYTHATPGAAFAGHPNPTINASVISLTTEALIVGFGLPAKAAP